MQLKKSGLIVFTAVMTFGLTVTLQSVLGLNIASPLGSTLDAGGNRIINVGTPVSATDAANFNWVNSSYQVRITGTCAVGSIIRVINTDGSVVCE